MAATSRPGLRLFHQHYRTHLGGPLTDSPHKIYAGRKAHPVEQQHCRADLEASLDEHGYLPTNDIEDRYAALRRNGH